MVTRGHGEHSGQMIGAINGGNIWWVAPSYPVASDIWRDLKKATREAWSDKSELERRIELPGGGAVTVKSADNPDSLRGSGLDGVVIDEAASVKPDVWQQAVRPALSDRQGWAVFIGTPRGFNWFHDLFTDAEFLPGWQRWQRPSSDNPLMTPAELAAARLEVGSIVYGQEYEAVFTADGLGMFKRHWFEMVDAAPARGKRVRYWDKAGTESGGAFTAGVRGCRDDKLFYIEDVVRGQWSSLHRETIIEQTAEFDAAQHGRAVEIWLEQEPGSGGKESAEISIRRLAGYNVHAERATGDKAVRAAPLAAQCEAGNVKLVRGEWNREFIDELCTFPFGKFKDQADAASGCFNKLALKPGRVQYRVS